MTLQQWQDKNHRARSYAHFDNKVSLKRVWDYISDPEKIASHSFYPFIHYSQSFNKYNREKGIKPKTRELCYSAHTDRYIFQYYGYLLNQKYNERTNKDGINNAAIAYRDNLKKNNIHFAKEVIDFIRRTTHCFIVVGDFTKFFDSLDHDYLKRMLCSLLECNRLSPDYFAVYKNVTKYATWEMDSILDINGLPHSPKGIKELNSKDKAIASETFKSHKKKYIQKHKEPYGIPQGSAISAVLSNVYMLEFDKAINDYVKQIKGLYRRYSDDFIIILPYSNVESFREQFNTIHQFIDSIPNLDLQPDKTQVFEYNNKHLRNCNTLVLSEIPNDKDILNYLGFSFDGAFVTIRDKTISKYYYRLYRKMKPIVKNKGVSPKTGKRISLKGIYKSYSIKGAHDGSGNFLTYVDRAKTIFGDSEAIDRSTKRHMLKIKRYLKSAK